MKPQTTNPKIGLITFHSSINYGTMLQAYALQKYLIMIGYECVIIDYVTKAHEREYFPEKNCKKPKNDFTRYEKFMHFMQNKMILTEKRYHTAKELEQDFPEFDIYLTGSDQVWNLDFVYDVTPIYFLNLSQFRNRIAYGPSIGKCNPKKMCLYKKYLKEYQYIFPRENSTAQSLSKFLNKTIEAVVDPTLLLNREEWKKMVKPSKRISPYLLFYIAEDDAYSFKKAKKVAKALGGLNIVAISYEKIYKGYHVYNCTSAGPIDFLNLIFNADFVFTTSFHGSIFSIKG